MCPRLCHSLEPSSNPKVHSSITNLLYDVSLCELPFDRMQLTLEPRVVPNSISAHGQRRKLFAKSEDERRLLGDYGHDLHPTIFYVI